jgi:HAD superfamily hydrolase (TIGR01490 family)
MTTQTLALFDFDGTITTKDTFAPYLFAAFGMTRVSAAFTSLGAHALMVYAGLSTRDRFKARLLARLFTGADCARLEAVGRAYAKTVSKWYRPAALERIRWHRERGHRLIMVSASLDLYLEHIARDLGFDDLLCTRMERAGAHTTGCMQGANCRAAEKVHRIEALLGKPLADFVTHAYGDSDGDAEMLRAAVHRFYRPFRDASANVRSVA